MSYFYEYKNLLNLFTNNFVQQYYFFNSQTKQNCENINVLIVTIV